MKVCIVGAGAIGGFIGTRLAAAGKAQVNAIARGPSLQALRTHGWRMRQGDSLIQAPAIAADDARDLGVMDLLIIAVKGPALTTVVGNISPFLAVSCMRARRPSSPAWYSTRWGRA